jgi:hypothetical protein
MPERDIKAQADALVFGDDGLAALNGWGLGDVEVYAPAIELVDQIANPASAAREALRAWFVHHPEVKAFSTSQTITDDLGTRKRSQTVLPPVAVQFADEVARIQVITGWPFEPASTHTPPQLPDVREPDESIRQMTLGAMADDIAAANTTRSARPSLLLALGGRRLGDVSRVDLAALKRRAAAARAAAIRLAPITIHAARPLRVDLALATSPTTAATSRLLVGAAAIALAIAAGAALGVIRT